MGDTSGCQPSLNNLAFYLQGVSVTPSSNITSEYFVTASLPSSASLRRVWQFTTQGTITGPDTATLTLDYTQAHINCPKYNITFENALNGTFTVHNQVFSANKFITYTLTSAYVLLLTMTLPKKIVECYGASTPQAYFLDITINDGSYQVESFTDGSGNFSLFNSDTSGNATVYYFCVGGGGGGQGSNTSLEYSYAGGGGGGYVTQGSFEIPPSTTYNCSYSIGLGGTGGSGGSSSAGGAGGMTSFAVLDGDVNVVSIDVSGGTGGINGNGGTSGSFTGGGGCKVSGGFAGGGGAGPTSNGGSSTCSTGSDPPNTASGSGGAGGTGYTWSPNGTSIGTYSGGGGGCGLTAYGAAASLNGVINGGNGGQYDNATPPTAGTNGGGGGGAALTYSGSTPSGAAGGNGSLTVVWYSTSIVYST